MTLPQSYFDEWQDARKGTVALSERIPDDVDLSWQPHPEITSFGELTRHIVGSMYFMLQSYFDRPFEIPSNIKNKEPLGKQEFIKHLKVTDKLMQETLQVLTADDLEQKYFISKRSGKKLSYSYLIWHIKEHEVHHRSQLKMYLKMLGNDTSNVGF